MKNVPERIYLQIDADGETPSDFNELHGVSWCSDKINDNDIEYLSLSGVMAKKKDFIIDFLYWYDERRNIFKSENVGYVAELYLKSINK